MCTAVAGGVERHETGSRCGREGEGAEPLRIVANPPRKPWTRRWEAWMGMAVARQSRGWGDDSTRRGENNLMSIQLGVETS